MLQELEDMNIKIANIDFDVYPGMILTSLPPHVSFEAFVNDTDNNTYRLSGMTQRAEVGNIGITKLEFFETSTELPIESILSQNNTIILKKKDGDKTVVPHNLIVYGNQDIQVRFQNDFLVPVRIQGDGDWQNPNWYGPTILPLTSATMSFKPGVYSWHARTLPAPGSVASDHMGGGEIFVMSDNMDEQPFHDRQRIGAAILQNSETPWSSMGAGNDKGITLGFNHAISDALPNYREYYLSRAEQLIHFDVPIILEEPFGEENED